MPNRQETIYLECPFCGEETIETIKEESFSSSRRGFGSDMTMKMVSVDCSNCNKDGQDILKKLKKKGFPIKNL